MQKLNRNLLGLNSRSGKDKQMKNTLFLFAGSSICLSCKILNEVFTSLWMQRGD